MTNNEKEFLREGKVVVTNARFIVPSQTYAMSGVTSVKKNRQDPDRKLPIIMIILGLIIILVSQTSGSIITTILLIGLGIFILTKLKPTYIIALNTSGGEMKALSSKDQEYIDKIIKALNESIIHRG